MKPLEVSIIATLCYHDLFDYPLNSKEIWRLLIQTPVGTSKKQKLNKNNFIQSLENLVKQDKISYKKLFYCLKNRENIINIRLHREKASQPKLNLVKKIITICSWLPWLKMVGITGALAMDNARKSDDIDLLIITQKNRLWLTRLIVTMVLEIIGRRRRPNHKNIKDKICLNLYLDEANWQLSKAKKNLFTAH